MIKSALLHTSEKSGYSTAYTDPYGFVVNYSKQTAMQPRQFLS